MVIETDPSRRPPEDYVQYRVGLAKAERSAFVQFANEKPFFTTGFALGLAIFAYRMLHARYRPTYLGKMQELNQYMIYTRLYCCGCAVSGGTIEMAREFTR